LNAISDAIQKIYYYSNPIQIIKDLINHRFLIQQMVSRDLTARYKGSILGLIWTIINPLVMLLVYTFVFSIVFNARWRPTSPNLPMGEFAVTLFAGLIPFNLLAEVLSRSPGIVVANPNYVKKVIFPLEILVVTITGTALINSLISLTVLLFSCLFILGRIPVLIILLPLIFFPLLLISLGIGWFLSSIGVFIRDIGIFITVFIQVLMFVTPIFYSPEAVPVRFQWIIKVNPLTMIVTDFRNLIIWNEPIDWLTWVVWTAIAIVIAILGYIWFRGTNKGFSDVL
jgi:lipopolysaccharide transport system permease protein